MFSEHIRRLAVVACVLLAVFAGGCASEAAVESGGPLVSTEGRIAFTRATSFEFPDFESEVYAINVDGSREKRLTDSPGLDAFPTWSPDGGRLAFVTDRDGNWEIYTMNPDGTDQRRLTNTPKDESSPTYSPDGERIAYVTNPIGMNPEISVMNADGSGRERLAAGNWPSWSSDGEKISYTAYGNGAKIYVMNADGSNARALTNGSWDEEGAYSPNGEKIAFSSGRAGFLWWENAEIYVMDADGSNQRRLTDLSGNDHWPPSWSPEGERIAFTSDGEEEIGEIFVMNADGSGLTQLTDNPADDAFPAWRP